jgi:hypothetical protein
VLPLYVSTAKVVSGGYGGTYVWRYLVTLDVDTWMGGGRWRVTGTQVKVCNAELRGFVDGGGRNGVGTGAHGGGGKMMTNGMNAMAAIARNED